jgi:hypothetical protein
VAPPAAETNRAATVDPEAVELAAAIDGTVNDLGGRFMLDGATYARGARLGFAGMDFYMCGRGGVLGPTAGAVVAAAMAFLGPDAVAANWDAGLGVMAPDEAAEHFIACAYDWAREHLGAVASSAAELVVAPARTVVEAADGTACALFVAWRTRPWPDPDDDAATLIHALHLLRELRGGAHAAAVRASGLTAHEAVVARGGAGTAAFLGWPEPHPDPDAGDLRARHGRACALTDEAMGRCLTVLDHDERAALRSGVDQLATAVG